MINYLIIVVHLEHREQESKPGRKRKGDDIDSPGCKQPCREQQSLRQCVRSGAQSTADRLIVNFIVMGMKPQSTVQEPDFKALVTGLPKLNTEVTVLSRRTLGRRIDDLEQTMLRKLVEVLSLPTYVCTTADIWSSNRRSFLGVTVHWIDDDLHRASAALTCK